MCEKLRKRTVKEDKMHRFFVYACKSQDLAQNQKMFARSHDRETVTFRKSGCYPHLGILASQDPGLIPHSTLAAPHCGA